MRSLRTLSKLLVIPPIVMLMYDLVHGWFVKARIKVRSLAEWWKDWSPDSFDPVKSFLRDAFSPKVADAFMNAPAPLSLLIFPLVLYVVYFIWFRLRGGHGSGAYIYKSHD